MEMWRAVVELVVVYLACVCMCVCACVCMCLEITFLETGSQPWDSTSNFNTSLEVLLSCVSLATYVHDYVYLQK